MSPKSQSLVGRLRGPDSPVLIAPALDREAADHIEALERKVALLTDAAQAALQYYGMTLTSMPPQSAWDYHRVSDRLRTAIAGAPEDPMDWPLPCDVTVGHGTIRKGCRLGTLVGRMGALHKLVSAYGPKSMQYDIEHPNDGLNSSDPAEVEHTHRGIVNPIVPAKPTQGDPN